MQAVEASECASGKVMFRKKKDAARAQQALIRKWQYEGGYYPPFIYQKPCESCGYYHLSSDEEYNRKAPKAKKGKRKITNGSPEEHGWISSPDGVYRRIPIKTRPPKVRRLLAEDVDVE